MLYIAKQKKTGQYWDEHHGLTDNIEYARLFHEIKHFKASLNQANKRRYWSENGVETFDDYEMQPVTINLY